MAIYYFDLNDNGVTIDDADGLEFESNERAFKEAVIALSEMSRDLKPEDGRKILRLSVYDAERKCIAESEIKYDPRGIYP
ncbi:hypothetical protein DEM27_22135 [Metarhizobium album]|uniref:DUF6894 domain-containing protein n=1 Tax=Metarhizobium album TaxID=2182425 RepID=A0A2U2DL65_9HYPH|nr:hypothetical protein [Rhizobium album]PWE54020.1 hypothetical protein DEM27_22135 [Rhizobium album]